MDHQPWEMIVEDALRHGDVAVARQVVAHELRRNPRNGTAWHILSTAVC
jgi:cobalamin biosynthesis protein CobD/CbiB